MVNNDGFIKAIFGKDYLWCHVTDFVYDPNDIPKDKHLIAWKGDYYSRYNLAEKTNQYFTISTFYCDDQNQARRRKALYRQTHCIVLDDVREKLSIDQVQKLPEPSWILQTSVGSEQWGYILDTPCTDRNKVENLLDGLVANGLAPDGRDPGMKGVTRYVRLPEGTNNKASKLVNGQPVPCKMLLWQPFHIVTMEQLAVPFVVDLNALRREQRVDGASAISDHPLINIPHIIHIKEIRSDGRFDIRCPWVDEHTGADDSGSAVFTNDDGTIGFKCHHGACQNRTGNDLLKFIDNKIQGWSKNQLKMWQIMRSFKTAAPEPVSFMHGPTEEPEISFMHGPTEEPEISFMHGPTEEPEISFMYGPTEQPEISFMYGPPEQPEISFMYGPPEPPISFMGDPVSFIDPPPPVSFMGDPVSVPPTPPVSFMGDPVIVPPSPPVKPIGEPVNFFSIPDDSIDISDVIKTLCDELQKLIPGTKESRDYASDILKHVDDLPKIDQKHWHNIVCDAMRWNKSDFKEILKDLRRQWYIDQVDDSDFYDSILFVKELNQFYDFKTRIFFSTEAFQNSYSHEDAEARKVALQDGRVKKVDKLDYAPKMPIVFIEDGITYGNMWSDQDQPKGEPGDVSRWIDHFKVLGWEKHRVHIEQWMAFTLRQPEDKINHMLLFGSGEGCGKDYLLYPLVMGMGENGYTISGDELTSDFDDYILSTKYLHINETDLADHRKAVQVSNKLKPIAAAPPTKITVNQKGIKRMKVRNIINGTMTTNSQLPLRLNGPSRRFFAVWSDLNTRDVHGQMMKEWEDYWEHHWQWMRGGGWKSVLHYLYNVVSLENFKPFSPPLVTDFLKEIQDSSKSPMQQTLESFINEQIGLFKSDLMTSQDMSDTIRTEGVFSTQHIYCDVKTLTPSLIGRMLASVPSVYKLKGVHHNSTIRISAIRNSERYVNMGPTELYQQYKMQIANCKGEKPNLTLLPIKKENTS